jgi:hypothetical protein
LFRLYPQTILATTVAAVRYPLLRVHGAGKAFEVVRGLVEEVRIIPAEGEITIELRGELAGSRAVADTAKKGLGSRQDKALQIKMVAGVGSEPTTFTLCLMPPRGWVTAETCRRGDCAPASSKRQ